MSMALSKCVDDYGIDHIVAALAYGKMSKCIDDYGSVADVQALMVLSNVFKSLLMA